MTLASACARSRAPIIRLSTTMPPRVLILKPNLIMGHPSTNWIDYRITCAPALTAIAGNIRTMTDAPKSALSILRTVFGYSSFRGEQAQIVDHIASGGDALVLMPTGGGKSLCYQLPALMRSGCGIVVSPLIALM